MQFWASSTATASVVSSIEYTRVGQLFTLQTRETGGLESVFVEKTEISSRCTPVSSLLASELVHLGFVDANVRVEPESGSARRRELSVLFSDAL